MARFRNGIALADPLAPWTFKAVLKARSASSDGVVASSSVLDTGFGFTYGPSLHIGATGWYLIASLAANPFQLGYRVIG